jgi:hypothetical protein
MAGAKRSQIVFRRRSAAARQAVALASAALGGQRSKTHVSCPTNGGQQRRWKTPHCPTNGGQRAKTHVSCPTNGGSSSVRVHDLMCQKVLDGIFISEDADDNVWAGLRHLALGICILRRLLSGGRYRT